MYISFGTILASGGRDGSIRMWDATSGAGLAEVQEAHADSIRGMTCDSTGRVLVTASADMSVKIWQQVSLSLVCLLSISNVSFLSPPCPQCDVPPPLPPRSSAALSRLKSVKFEDEPSDHDSDSDSADALAINHGVFAAHSKRSLAFTMDTPTDAEDECELLPHAAVHSADAVSSGNVDILSPISGSPVAISSLSIAKRKSARGLSARPHAVPSDSGSKKQSHRRCMRNSSSNQPAMEQSAASGESSFIDSPSGPSGATALSATSAASADVRAAAAHDADPSTRSSSSSDNYRICIDCGSSWSFESKEREYFAAKGLHTPRRCSKCRSLKKPESVALVRTSCADSNASSASGSVPVKLPSAETSDGAEVGLPHADGSEIQRHGVYRGTNLLGIGFVYEGEVNACGRQEGFGTQVLGY
jgi:WD40 repeat protein